MCVKVPVFTHVHVWAGHASGSRHAMAWGSHHHAPTCRAGSQPQPPHLREPHPAPGCAGQRLRLPGPWEGHPPPPFQRVRAASQLALAQCLLFHSEQAGSPLCPGELSAHCHPGREVARWGV